MLCVTANLCHRRGVTRGNDTEVISPDTDDGKGNKRTQPRKHCYDVGPGKSGERWQLKRPIGFIEDYIVLLSGVGL